jgi:hypothetical protein
LVDGFDDTLKVIVELGKVHIQRNQRETITLVFVVLTLRFKIPTAPIIFGGFFYLLERLVHAAHSRRMSYSAASFGHHCGLVCDSHDRVGGVVLAGRGAPLK